MGLHGQQVCEGGQGRACRAITPQALKVYSGGTVAVTAMPWGLCKTGGREVVRGIGGWKMYSNDNAYIRRPTIYIV